MMRKEEAKLAPLNDVTPPPLPKFRTPKFTAFEDRTGTRPKT